MRRTLTLVMFLNSSIQLIHNAGRNRIEDTLTLGQPNGQADESRQWAYQRPTQSAPSGTGRMRSNQFGKEFSCLLIRQGGADDQFG